jgi:hypothetical protein
MGVSWGLDRKRGDASAFKTDGAFCYGAFLSRLVRLTIFAPGACPTVLLPHRRAKRLLVSFDTAPGPLLSDLRQGIILGA